MFQRFADRKNIHKLIQQSTDFKTRNYGSYIVWICCSLIIVLLTLQINFSGVGNILLKQEVVLTAVDIIHGAVVLLATSLVLGGYLFLIIFKLHRIVNVSEFQSLIFASAMRADTLFCFIVNQEQEILYSHSCDDIFCGVEFKTLEDILKFEGISAKDKKNMLQVIADNKSKTAPITYKNSQGKTKHAQISLNPVGRPQGYFVLRGYKAD